VQQDRCIYKYLMEPSEIARAIGAECLCFRSRRLARVLTRHFDEALRPAGIQATQLTLLAAIAGPGPAGQSMPRLHEFLAMDPTTLSRNLKPLQNGGLVVVERAETDKRARIVKLTADGERVLTKALPLWRAAQDRLIENLGEGGSVALRRQLELAAPFAETAPLAA
jgi:DNA-binding MarR family transcriptional regulator